MPIHSGIYSFHRELASAQYPPLVLIHGAGGSHLSWPSQVRRLNNHEVYALDLPGHGKSTGPGQQRISTYADEVVKWMGAIDLHRAFIVGHSMGGAIALTMARKQPALIAGLALIGTGARLPVDPEILENTTNPTTYPTAVRKIILGSFHPATSESMTTLVEKRLLQERGSVLHGDLKACEGFDLSQGLEAIRMPTLVICGGDDRMVPLRNSQVLVNKIPQAALEVIEDSGHMVMLEKPERVATTIQEFLRGKFGWTDEGSGP